MFPMDLIGPTDSPWFSMALRRSSPAVLLMQRAGRQALSSVPLSYKGFAYELAKHHKQVSIDWKALPFPTRASPAFAFPVPTAALRVREVVIERSQEVGSHMLFVTSVVRETLSDPGPDDADGLQLFHVHGAYHQHLSRSGVSLTEG